MAGFDAEEKKRYGARPFQLFKFTTGSASYYYTSIDNASTTYGGHSYLPKEIACDEGAFSQEVSAGSREITVARDNPVAALYGASSPVDAVAVVIYAGHRDDADVVIEFIGTVITIRYEGASAVLICAPAGNAFKRKIPAWHYTNHCALALYGARCGVNKAAFEYTHTVDAIADDTVTLHAYAALADWVANGWMELTARAVGRKRFIYKSTAGGVITLKNAFPGGELLVGDTVKVYAGCKRTMDECKTKFANAANFFGFPFIPIFNPFDGTINGEPG